MALDNLGYTSIALQSESQILDEDQWKDLSSRFKTIYTLLDFDLTGVRSSNKMRKKYGTIPKFYTNGRFGTKDFGAKDTSDLCKIRERAMVSKILQGFFD